MKNVLDTINHPKATPEKIKQMKDNGWTDQEIAEKFAKFARFCCMLPKFCQMLPKCCPDCAGILPEFAEF